jgi:hypothetical protein
MPYEQGTAANYLDLLGKLKTFLTSSASMGSQAWTPLSDTTSSGTTDGTLQLMGTGLSGVDAIYCSITTYSSPTNGYYHWILNGSTGYNSSFSSTGQAGCIPADSLNLPRIPLLNSSITYTFVANGRRFIVITIVGTIVESCYCGWITPYGPSNRWPEPLFIGGTHNSATSLISDVTDSHTWWLQNKFSSGTNSSAYLRGVDGTWRRNRLYAYNVSCQTADPNMYCWPAAGAYNTNLEAPMLDGSYYLRQMEVMINDSYMPVLVGKLDGVYWLTGFNLTSSDLITMNSVSHYVFQNAFRTNVDSFAAVALA